MMGSFTVTIFGYVGQTISFRVSMYKYNYTWFNPTITWIHGDSSKVSNIEFYKEDDSNLHLKVNFATNFGAYNKTVITDVLANYASEVLHNPDTYTISVNPDNSAYTLSQTTSNTGFIRDNMGDAPKASIYLATSDLNTITIPGFYYQLSTANATAARNYPALFAGCLNVYKTTTGAVVQEYTLYHTGVTYKRIFNSVIWVAWTQLIDSVNGGTLTADLSVTKTDGGNVNIGTGGTAGTTASPKFMSLNFTGYASTVKAKISSSDVGGNSVLSPLIFHTYAQTGLQESMRIQGGGNIDFVGNLNRTTGELILQRNSVNRFRTNSTETIISGENGGNIYLRPNGDISATGQVTISSGGTIGTSSHGDSFQWKQAYDWGNHATAGYTNQAWVQSQNYATNNLVEVRINELIGEIIDPASSFSIKNEFTTVILTENYSKEPIELEGELIPGRYLSITNLTGSSVELTQDHYTIDIINETETSEYYITNEGRLIKKGAYKNAKTLI